MFKMLDKAMFSKIKARKTVKQIWDKITLICEGSDQIKENKLTSAMQNFDNFKMKLGETLDD